MTFSSTAGLLHTDQRELASNYEDATDALDNFDSPGDDHAYQVMALGLLDSESDTEMQVVAAAKIGTGEQAHTGTVGSQLTDSQQVSSTNTGISNSTGLRYVCKN
jgi:hypothetical protein